MNSVSLIQPALTRYLPVSVRSDQKRITTGEAQGYDPQVYNYGSAPEITAHMDAQEEIFLPGGPRAQTGNPFNDNLMNFQFPSSKTNNEVNANWARGGIFAWPYSQQDLNKRVEYGVEVPLQTLPQTRRVVSKDNYHYPDPAFTQKIKKSKDFITYPRFQSTDSEGMPFFYREFYTNGVSLTLIILIALLIFIIWRRVHL